MITEKEWSERWGARQVTIHRWTNDVNSKLQRLNKDIIVVSSIVDATCLDRLAHLSSQFKKVHVVSDHHVSNRWNNVLVHNLPIDFYGAYYIPDVETNRKIEKNFNCFLNRIDPIRQTWFYLLYARGYLEQSYTSFNMHELQNACNPRKSCHETLEYYHQNFLSSFDGIKDEIKKMVPYKNFIDNDNLREIILSTKFSVVVEPYFERPDCKVVSEKTWRAIQLPRPWLLFAATGCVQRLRDMGFDVFDDYVDHSYDLYDTKNDCVARQEGIFSEISKLSELKITPDILHDWQKKASHNRRIMKKWAESWESKCLFPFETILKLEL